MRRSTIPVVLILMFACSAAANAQAPSGAPTGHSEALATRVQSALRASDIAGAEQIKVEAQSDSVQLSGFVESEEDQESALQTARAVPGVAAVRNDLVVRESRPTVGQALDDTIIAAQVRKQIESKVAEGSRDINITVSDGVVQLSGYVADANLKTRAADVASAVSGVQDVRNDLALK
jgi:hyperosmotically inducible periplasmic protein